MKRNRNSEERVAILTECERLLGDGMDLTETCRCVGISESTWYRWKARFGSMISKDARRIEELEQENGRLKNIVVKLALEVDMLRETPYESS